ncbi:cell division protein ZapA [Niabella digestorum]|jgi:Cell division protein ZapA.|uniref:Cell division protein ZapA n=1 Tax=Niabella digestorum TaxID=3117701 RepID=A0ABU7RI58_9BACT
MEQKNLIPANINIADRIYRVQMLPDDEQVVRQSVKLINDKIMEFKTTIPGKDMQDYLSMVLVWFVTESANKSVSLANESLLLSQLQHIESVIEEELEK